MPDPIVKPIARPKYNRRVRSVRAPECRIHGFQQCCSAAILHGVGGYSYVHTWPTKKKGIPGLDAMRYREHDSIEGYVEWARTCSFLQIPESYVYYYVLEQIHDKAKYGRGGNNMYASSNYATKTWFIADRRRNADSISCMNFMNWLKKMGVAKVGRIYISPWAPGAHGGECKGGVYTPKLSSIEILIGEALKELNAHSKRVFKHYGMPTDGTCKLEQQATDEVGDLW